MASGSQNMTTYNARTVTGSNSAASPAGALLLSGAGRADDATGDTWIFLDSSGGTSTPWGIKHDQANNKIQIFGAGTNSVWTEMDTGNTYIGGSLNTGSTLTVRAQDDAHEGGEIILSPATDSFSTVHIDAYNSIFRLHDGTNERFKVDISTGNATINGNLGIGADYAVLGGSYKLYVNGNTYFNGNTTHNGIDYFANGTTYYINNSAVAYLNDLRSDNVRLVDNWIGFYQNANADGSRYGYIQANADSMYFRKENGVSTYHFDFNGHLYASSNLYAGGSVLANNGLIFSTYNGIQAVFGAQNTGWVHFTNNGGKNWYFDHPIHAVTGFTVYNTDTSLTNNNLTFASGGGWYMIDTTWVRTCNDKAVYTGSGTLRSDESTWGQKVRMTSNWLGFYSENGGGTRYGYIQCDDSTMYFRKETGSATNKFDFNGQIYCSGGINTGMARARGGFSVLSDASSGNCAVWFYNQANSVAYWKITVSSNTNQFVFARYDNGSLSNKFWINNNGTTGQSSSRFIKHNIQNITLDTGFIIDKMQPVSYIVNGDVTNKTTYGFIYEDLIQILPNVCDNNNGNIGITYTALIPILTKEIQNLRRRLASIETELKQYRFNI